MIKKQDTNGKNRGNTNSCMVLQHSVVTEFCVAPRVRKNWFHSHSDSKNAMESSVWKLEGDDNTSFSRVTSMHADQLSGRDCKPFQVTFFVCGLEKKFSFAGQRASQAFPANTSGDAKRNDVIVYVYERVVSWDINRINKMAVGRAWCFVCLFSFLIVSLFDLVFGNEIQFSPFVEFARYSL